MLQIFTLCLHLATFGFYILTVYTCSGLHSQVRDVYTTVREIQVY